MCYTFKLVNLSREIVFKLEFQEQDSIELWMSVYIWKFTIKTNCRIYNVNSLRKLHSTDQGKSIEYCWRHYWHCRFLALITRRMKFWCKIFCQRNFCLTSHVINAAGCSWWIACTKYSNFYLVKKLEFGVLFNHENEL